MNKKWIKKSICLLVSGALLTTALAACGRGQEEPVSDAAYLQTVSQYGFWKNTAETAIPEYRTYHHVHAFFDACDIQNGSAVAPNGKVRKALFIGFDGMRADALPYVLDTAGNAATGTSGIARLQQEGGVYLAYCGGETGMETEQTTSTSASWTAHFTGCWGNENGIKTNEDTKNLNRKTFMLEYAEQGLQTTVAFDWDPFFDINLTEELEYVMSNDLPMRFCDIDRAKADKLPETDAKTLELYNFAAAETPSTSAPYDTGMRDYILERMEAGDDIICGIFHNIDTAGHQYAFGESSEYTGAVISCDLYAYSILQAVQAREEAYGEEWLVVFANDHGGIGQGHGGQSLEERTTWIATNIPFDETYFASGYNGFQEN